MTYKQTNKIEIPLSITRFGTTSHGHKRHMVYTVDMLYTADMVYTVDMVYTIDMVYTVDTLTNIPVIAHDGL